jgi:hypothetical protein
VIVPDPRNAPAHEIRQRLDAFVDWRKENLLGDEKGEAQIYLDRLFQALGYGGVYEAGARLEYRVANDNGGTSFADLLWKPRVLIEMKKTKTDLSRHFRQAFNYWARAVPDRPRYVILCNFDELWVYDFENQIDAPVERILLDDLSARWEALGFLMPEAIEPVFGNDLIAVTRDAARDVAKVFMSLKKRGVKPADAQRFSLQCVMSMFAEDIGLLPQHSFTRAIHDASNGREAYDLIGGLFREMNTPGLTAGGRYVDTPYFNGGLFATISPQELTDVEVALLREAAATQWSDVRPEIFGTLFEGSLDAGERHASGAHFTSQADIARIIGPVVVEPWLGRIAAAKTIKSLNGLLEAMSQYRVLDPACGSGNFLYIAYREMRRLEREVIEKIRERRKSEGLAGQESFGYISPEQFFGIDVNPFAVEVAKVTMLLGKKLADDEMHEVGRTLPLDNLDSVIIAGDALFTEWPKVEAIVGNPPFIGRRKMVTELGASYAAKLDAKFGPKGVSDFVTYWFPMAHDHIPVGGRVGFIGTKSIKQGDGRKASLDYVVENDGVIIEAVSHMPWSGEANVTVSVASWQKGGVAPAIRTLWLENGTQPLELTHITAALSPEIDLKAAVALDANRGGVNQGQTLGIADVFTISEIDARRFVAADPLAKNVLHPLLGGNQLLKKLTSSDWVIDIPDKSLDEAYRKYPTVMQYLETNALPIRQAKAAAQAAAHEIAYAANPRAKLNKHHAGFLNRWWMLGWRREELLAATQELDRYIALTRTSSELRGPVFAFVDGRFRVSDSVVAFPYSDDYSFGVLQSMVHVTWFRERCTTLETRLTYTSDAVFRSFPWPQAPDADSVDRVARAAVAIGNHRARAFELGSTLAKQYDVLRKPGSSTLRDLHAELDEAVVSAYGFNQEDDVLTQILELNLLLAQQEKEGIAVTKAGPQPTQVPTSTHKWPVQPQL